MSELQILRHQSCSHTKKRALMPCTVTGPAMSRTHKIINLIGVPMPLVGVIAAVVVLWNRAVGPLELTLLVALYVLTAFGITLGFHRMFTHRALETSPAVRAILAVLG